MNNSGEKLERAGKRRQRPEKRQAEEEACARTKQGWKRAPEPRKEESRPEVPRKGSCPLRGCSGSRRKPRHQKRNADKLEKRHKSRPSRCCWSPVLSTRQTFREDQRRPRNGEKLTTKSGTRKEIYKKLSDHGICVSGAKDPINPVTAEWKQRSVDGTPKTRQNSMTLHPPYSTPRATSGGERPLPNCHGLG